MAVPINVGNKRTPVDLGYGVSAYKRNGRWLYRDSERSRKFAEVTDAQLMVELEKRGFKVLYPAHECVDRPNLACPTCQRDSLRALGLLKDCG